MTKMQFGLGSFILVVAVAALGCFWINTKLNELKIEPITPNVEFSDWAEPMTGFVKITSSTRAYVKSGEVVWSSNVKPKITLSHVSIISYQDRSPNYIFSGIIEHPSVGFAFQNFSGSVSAASSTEQIANVILSVAYERLRIGVENELAEKKLNEVIE